MVDYSEEQLLEAFKEFAKSVQGKNYDNLSNYEVYDTICEMVKSLAKDIHADSSKKGFDNDEKEIYYFSMEFLIGRLLKEYLVNLGAYEKVKNVCNRLHYDLDKVFEEEPDPGLGNGGLGRLAACFMDSMASIGVSAMGMGLKYKFGLFKQKIVDGEQIELPDDWLKNGYPWETRRSDRYQIVKFGGVVDREWNNGNFIFHYRDYMAVKAVPYDIPLIGQNGKRVNTLRLWRAEPAVENFDLEAFNNGDYSKAVNYRNSIDAITLILYPDDRNAVGKKLRLEQEYLLVSAGIQDIIRRYKKGYGDKAWDKFSKRVAIHINDTHPTMCIPELIRILMDDEGLGWDEAYRITVETIAYTNHTVMPEALEKWSIELLKSILPRIYMIIEEINRRFFEKLDKDAGYQVERTSKNSILYDGNIYMANLSVICSHNVNGVAAIHSEIIKKETLNELYKLMPEKFNNITNGVSHRRFLMANDELLTALLNKTIGTDWQVDPIKLNKLIEYKDNTDVLSELKKIKYQNKLRLVKYIKEHNDIIVDPDSVFDIQVKRIHAYKRQLLFMFKALNTYYGIKNGTLGNVRPQTFIMSGKAANSYLFAKKTIKLFNTIADLVNNDKQVNDVMKVIFLENFNVSVGEITYPAADISEQISLAGKEASGTGNMKFMMNGAVTLGTMDGANVEIFNLVGNDNIKIFGLREEEVSKIRNGGYNPSSIADKDNRLDNIRNLLRTKIVPENKVDFYDIYDELFSRGDEYMVVQDFADYIAKSNELLDEYGDDMKFNRMSLINIGKSGYFSSDRTIYEYYDKIWKNK